MAGPNSGMTYPLGSAALASRSPCSRAKPDSSLPPSGVTLAPAVTIPSLWRLCKLLVLWMLAMFRHITRATRPSTSLAMAARCAQLPDRRDRALADRSVRFSAAAAYCRPCVAAFPACVAGCLAVVWLPCRSGAGGARSTARCNWRPLGGRPGSAVAAAVEHLARVDAALPA